MRAAMAMLLAAALAACGVGAPPPDTPVLPPGIFGSGPDQDVGALASARNAFTDPSKTYGNPIAAAEAVIAIEYLAGALSTHPQWPTISADTKDDFLQARREVRAAVGIAPGAPSQLVVNSLLAARNDLASGENAAAEKALDNPAFLGGGAKAIAALGNLPFIRMASVATQNAEDEIVQTPPAGTVF